MDQSDRSHHQTDHVGRQHQAPEPPQSTAVEFQPPHRRPVPPLPPLSERAKPADSSGGGFWFARTSTPPAASTERPPFGQSRQHPGIVPPSSKQSVNTTTTKPLRMSSTALNSWRDDASRGLISRATMLKRFKPFVIPDIPTSPEFEEIFSVSPLLPEALVEDNPEMITTNAGSTWDSNSRSRRLADQRADPFAWQSAQAKIPPLLAEVPPRIPPHPRGSAPAPGGVQDAARSPDPEGTRMQSSEVPMGDWRVSKPPIDDAFWEADPVVLKKTDEAPKPEGPRQAFFPPEHEVPVPTIWNVPFGGQNILLGTPPGPPVTERFSPTAETTSPILSLLAARHQERGLSDPVSGPIFPSPPLLPSPDGSFLDIMRRSDVLDVVDSPLEAEVVVGDVPLTPIIDDQRAVWQYRDRLGEIQGLFSSARMLDWWRVGFFPPNLLMRYDQLLPFVPFNILYPPALLTTVTPFLTVPRVYSNGQVVYPSHLFCLLNQSGQQTHLQDKMMPLPKQSLAVSPPAFPVDPKREPPMRPLPMRPSVPGSPRANPLTSQASHMTNQLRLILGMPAKHDDLILETKLSAIDSGRRQVEEASRLHVVAELDARRQAAELEARRHAVEFEARRQAAELEVRCQAAELETRRKAAELESRRQVAELENRRLAVDLEVRRQAAGVEATRQAAELEARLKAAELKAAEFEAGRNAAELEAKRHAAHLEDARRQTVELESRCHAAELETKRQVAELESRRYAAELGSRRQARQLEVLRQEASRRADTTLDRSREASATGVCTPHGEVATPHVEVSSFWGDEGKQIANQQYDSDVFDEGFRPVKKPNKVQQQVQPAQKPAKKSTSVQQPPTPTQPPEEPKPPKPSPPKEAPWAGIVAKITEVSTEVSPLREIMETQQVERRNRETQVAFAPPVQPSATGWVVSDKQMSPMLNDAEFPDPSAAAVALKSTQKSSPSLGKGKRPENKATVPLREFIGASRSIPGVGTGSAGRSVWSATGPASVTTWPVESQQPSRMAPKAPAKPLTPAPATVSNSKETKPATAVSAPVEEPQVLVLSSEQRLSVERLMANCRVELDADMIDFLTCFQSPDDVEDFLRDSLGNTSGLHEFSNEFIAIVRNPFEMVQGKGRHPAKKLSSAGATESPKKVAKAKPGKRNKGSKLDSSFLGTA